MSERNPDAAESIGQPLPHIDKLLASIYDVLEDLRNAGVDAIGAFAVAKDLALYELENRVSLLQEVPESVELDAKYTARKLAKNAETPEGSIKLLEEMGVPIELGRRLIDHLKFAIEARVGPDELVKYYLGSVARGGAGMVDSARNSTSELTGFIKGLAKNTPDWFLRGD